MAPTTQSGDQATAAKHEASIDPSSSSPAKKKKPKMDKESSPDENNADELSDDEFRRILRADMWPPKPVQGETLKELKELLQAGFVMEEVEDFYQSSYNNMLKFVRKHGLAWINALHDFENTQDDDDDEDDDDDDDDDDDKDEKPPKLLETPLLYVLKTDNDDHRTVDLLLEWGADANIRVSHGRPPLLRAIRGWAPRWKTVNYLIESGGANCLAEYRGRTIAGIARANVKDNNEEVHRMIWDSMKQKLGSEFMSDDEGSDSEDSGRQERKNEEPKDYYYDSDAQYY